MKQIPHIRDLHHILVCRGEGSLGDAIISSCCCREIKKANPQVKITVACFGPAYDFFKHNPYVDEVFKLPAHTRLRPNQRWLGLLLAGLKLRRRKFDLVLDTSLEPYLNWRMFKRVAGGNKVLDQFSSPVQPFGAPDKHGSEHEAAVLKLLGIENPDKSYDLPILPSARQSVTQWLEEHHISKYILFNPSGSVAQRRFKPDTMKEICKAMEFMKCPFIVPVMADQFQQMTEAFKDMPNVFVKQTADIFELFEWVRLSALVITPDTSVVHIAAGFEKPSLTFYNDPKMLTSPGNPKAKVMETDKNDVNIFDWWKFESLVAQLKQWL